MENYRNETQDLRRDAEPRTRRTERRYRRKTRVKKPEAGTVHYVISFLLAGLIGVAIQYWLRERGWLGVIVNVVAGVIIWTLFFALDGSSEPT